MSQGLTLRQASAADVLMVRGVLDLSTADFDTAPLRALILTDLPGLIADFNAMRAAEGAALQTVIAAQLDRIAALSAQAKTEADARRDASASLLRDALARVMSNAEGVDETRPVVDGALTAPVAPERHLLVAPADLVVQPVECLAHGASILLLRLDPVTQHLLFAAHVLDQTLNALGKAGHGRKRTLGADHGAHKQNGRALGAPGRCGVIAVGDQAMNTAMKASRKISTPPATGSTMGMSGTMDSTTS